jgi:hypothetical protein
MTTSADASGRLVLSSSAGSTGWCAACGSAGHRRRSGGCSSWIDGLSRSVLQRGRTRRMPFLRRLLEQGGTGCTCGRAADLDAGLPDAMMYGVAPDIRLPLPRQAAAQRRLLPAGDAAHVRATRAAGRLGIVTGRCVRLRLHGQRSSLLTFAISAAPPRPACSALSAVVVLAWVIVRAWRSPACRSGGPCGARPIRSGAARLEAPGVQDQRLGLDRGFTLSAARDLYAGTPVVT